MGLNPNYLDDVIMLDQLKFVIEKSRHHLENIVDRIEDQSEDLSEDAMELWQETKPRLRALKESLVTAEQSFQTQTDEARLQAHLAILDAHDQWSYLSQVVSELAHHTQQKGQTELQRAELQAHLAKMDARDFLNEKGEQIRQDFGQVRKTLDHASQKAVDELEKSLDTIGQAWANSR
jgi:exonuclease VII small subunit